MSEENFPFEPEAWQKMEKKLDALNDDDTNRKPFWWWLAPLVLLLLGTGAFIWWRSTAPATNHLAETAKTAGGTTAPADTGWHKNERVVTSNNNNQAIPPAATPASPAAVPSASQKKNSTGIAATEKQYAGTANKNNGKTTTPSTIINRPAAGKALPTSNNAAQPVSGNITGTDILHSSSPAGKNAASGENEILRLLSTHYFTNPAVPSKINGGGHLALKEIAEKSPKKQAIPQRRGFSIGLTLGPVFNVAPSLEYGHFGLDGGLLVNYHVNNRWSFTTGVVYSDKPYGGTRNDYKVVKTWSYPMNQVKRINANCRVLDIPVNINYTFMDKPAYTLTASAGLSSYLMLKENYSYKRDYMSDWEKSLSNENQHYLSVLNLGFSYQFPLNNRMSLGIQPFAKIPLRDIGYGQVKLYSTGVAVQLNFNRFNRKQ
ncbi:MAG TPA: outer membrane beta-barrel protein [Chitinophaga sp.]|uniref:outer membrane beta-barrel protein n=1 Tax=Chitinophaga sp. TaxID=1869181 RepID=UPI002DBF3EB3|nr:outer membrane beta-barrel protein [Chitinophaga sp.]HEU4552494.1 outer membrane beta-barrel protein [Chitinophaga sp.]